MSEQATTMAIIFEDEPDRNMRMEWGGPIPRVGEHVELQGRDFTYIVADVVWVLDPQIAEKRLERGVRVHVRKVQ